MSDLCCHCSVVIDPRPAKRMEAGAVCQRCYAAHYCPTVCASCGRVTRTYRGEAGLCSVCCRKDPRFAKGCTACGAPVRMNGQNRYKLQLCHRCKAKAAPLKRCSVCNKESRALLTGGKHQGAPICRRCAYPGEFATCSGCRKWRRVADHTPDGKVVCAKCKVAPSIVCDECGRDAPRYNNSTCEPCARKRVLTQQAKGLAAEIQNPHYRAMFDEFASDWIASRKLNSWCRTQLRRYARVP